MKVLIACEESQTVCKAFRALGHEAFSCDIQDGSGGHPEWHIKGDAIEQAYGGKWDLMIAHPPCTDLAVSGAAWFEKKRKDGSQQRSIDFFMCLANAPIEKICVENPVCIMSRLWRKPDQIVHPYFFGDSVCKATCLWLKNLKPLEHFAEDTPLSKKTHVEKGKYITSSSGKRYPEWCWKTGGGSGKKRSVFFPGIANAMAQQWGGQV